MKNYSQSIFLAFEPEKDIENNTIKYFQLFLINDTNQSINYFIKQFQQNRFENEFIGNLLEVNSKKLCTIPFIDLDNNLLFEMKFIFNDHHTSVIKKIQKIKTKSFFKNFKKAPIINEEVYLIKCVSESDITKLYTANTNKNHLHIDVENIKEALLTKTHVEVDSLVSNSSNIIDLHIENLVKDKTGLNNDEILKIQLDHAQDSLEKAIANNYSTIIFIHGVGSGKLKEKISVFLRNNEFVKSFSNSYDKRFGFGATEVLLK